MNYPVVRNEFRLAQEQTQESFVGFSREEIVVILLEQLKGKLQPYKDSDFTEGALNNIKSQATRCAYIIQQITVELDLETAIRKAKNCIKEFELLLKGEAEVAAAVKGKQQDDQSATEITVMSVLATASMAASAYHGYKRNESVGWAIWWGFMGLLFPIITPVIAIAQGYGKRAKE